MKPSTMEYIEKMQQDPEFINDMTRWKYESAKEELERLQMPQYPGLAAIEEKTEQKHLPRKKENTM